MGTAEGVCSETRTGVAAAKSATTKAVASAAGAGMTTTAAVASATMLGPHRDGQEERKRRN